ncbi:MAG: EF-hand domain-containing protein [Burkholderiales bacterium]|jgi:Ca2+-binding EF-hand superfamily protein|nr:EF-hand domain-containing protein [Burkholderiales bacterium]
MTLLHRLSVTAICAAALISTPAAFAAHEKLEAAFKAADKDGDGTLDKSEAAAMKGVAKHFDMIDADKDGTVSMDEVKAHMADMKGKARGGMHEKAKARFAAADKDKDGTLDKTEAAAMPHVAKHFDVIDADKDGTVTLDEVHAFMKSHKD